MDHNLEKIKEDNMHAIIRGSVQKAISQAEDYLTYIIGFDTEKIKQELDVFIADIKAIRRESRGQKRKERFRQEVKDQHRHKTPGKSQKTYPSHPDEDQAMGEIYY